MISRIGNPGAKPYTGKDLSSEAFKMLKAEVLKQKGSLSAEDEKKLASIAATMSSKVLHDMGVA